MSGQRSVEDLFAAARDDAPSSAVRDAVWGRVATSTVAAAAAPAAIATTATAAAKAAILPASTKILALGAAIGAAGAVATIVAVSFASGAGSAQTTMTARSARTPAVVVRGPTAGARLAVEAPRPRTAPSALLAPPSSSEPERAVADETSSLAEEARLVTEARSALIGGEPERALALARQSHTLPVRALEPEELALEARCLRALGRVVEAGVAEATLRQRFPNHALAR